jgi:hypothetical protein
MGRAAILLASAKVRANPKNGSEVAQSSTRSARRPFWPAVLDPPLVGIHDDTVLQYAPELVKLEKTSFSVNDTSTSEETAYSESSLNRR